MQGSVERMDKLEDREESGNRWSSGRDKALMHSLQLGMSAINCGLATGL